MPERKKPLGRLSCRWEDVKMDLKETGREVMDWTNFVQESGKWLTAVNTDVKFRVR
jgi:hypothetical protein